MAMHVIIPSVRYVLREQQSPSYVLLRVPQYRPLPSVLCSGTNANRSLPTLLHNGSNKVLE